MASNSLLSAFALGRQSAKGTQATKLFTTLATVSGMGTEFETSDQINEHPASVSARVWGQKAGGTIRTGYTVPYKATFRARPNFIGAALVSMGYVPTVVAGTGYYTHTFVLTTPTLFPWCSAFHADDDAGTQWERVTKDSHSEKLSFDADYKRVQCELTGKGLIEGLTAGTPTRTAEVADQFLPTEGSFAATIGGVAITSVLRGLKLDIENEFDEEDYVLFQTSRNDRLQTNAKASGTLGGIDFSAALYKKLNYGGTGGTAPSLVIPTGPVSFTYRSAANIPSTAQPYSISIVMSSTNFTLPSDVAANDKDLIRLDAAFTVNDDTEPLTVTLINNVASYAA